MATGVSFGRPVSKIYQPGAYTQVDASALELAQDFAPNVVCVIGQALGGTPLQTYAFNNPTQAQQVFGPGSPLADAIALAMRGGVKGGAPLVLGVRADNSAKAVGTLNPANGTNLRGTFNDFGGYGNTYSVSFLPGSAQGTQALILGTFVDGTEYRQTIDNEPSFSNLVERINATSPVMVEVLAGGTKAAQTVTLATSTADGRAEIRDANNVLRSSEAYFYQYPASFQANTSDSLTISYTTTSSWSITADVTTDVLTATGAALTNGTPVYVRGAAVGNLNANTVYYVVNASGDTFKVAATSGGADIDLTGTFTTARVVLAWVTVSVSSALPATVEGSYNVAHLQEAYSLPVTDAAFSLTAYGSNIYRVTLTGANVWGNPTKGGKIGSLFTIASGDYAGTYQVLHYEWDGTGADKIRTVQRLTAGEIAAGTVSTTLAFQSSLSLDPTSQPATEALETQLPANGVLPRGGQFVTLTVTDPARIEGPLSVYYATQPGDTIQGVGQELARLINESTDWPSTAIAVATYNGGTFTSTITVQATKPGQVANGYKIGVLVNVQSQLLAATGGLTLTGGIDPEPPRDAQGNITGQVVLTSGFDSVPTLQRWLDALETIKYTPLRYLVPAAAVNAGVQAAFADHCRQMSATNARRERIAILGHGLGWTPAAIRARAETFNSERTVFVSPGLQMADLVTGSQRMYSSAYATAPMVAGMLAAEGNGVSDPITHTFLTNVTKAEINYQPGSLELDAMLISGVLTIEKDPTLVRESRGYRVTRGITTARSSAVFEQISIINQSDYTAQVIRDMEETLFVGTALDSSTLAVIRESINLSLNRLSDQRIIYGFDPNYTAVTQNPSNRSALDATYKIYPAPAIDFILNSQLLFPIPDAQATADIAA